MTAVMLERTITASNRDFGVDEFARLAKSFMPGKDITLTVSEVKRERTSKQLHALFGVAYKSLMDQMGLRGAAEKDELHSTFCGEFFGWRTDVILGVARKVPVRTTTTDENGNRDVISSRGQLELYSFIQQKSAEYGYTVPDPDREWFRKSERDAELEAEANKHK